MPDRHNLYKIFGGIFIKPYIILSANDQELKYAISELEKKVADAQKNGYITQGGISITFGILKGYPYHAVAQAMKKKEEE